MSTHNICFRGEIREISILLDRKKHLIKTYAHYMFLCRSRKKYQHYLICKKSALSRAMI